MKVHQKNAKIFLYVCEHMYKHTHTHTVFRLNLVIFFSYVCPVFLFVRNNLMYW